MIRRLILLPAAILALAGCGVGHRTFYMLTADGPAPATSGPGIGIGPVSLAEYIDRPNLVVAESDHELGIAENHRWAGDLAASITRVTAANLGRRLKTGNVRTYPWRGDDEIRHQITIDIRQLHGGPDGHAVIEAAWRIHALPDRRIVRASTFVDREPLASDGYDSLVAAQSKLLSRLADDISRNF